MSVHINWNPDFEDEVKRMAVRNLTLKCRAALAKVTCPNHGEHPTIEANAESWQIHACCERGKELALEAIRKWKTALRPSERREIVCGERHFKVVTEASELP